MFPKDGTWRSEPYRRAVATLECCNCGHEEPGLFKSQAAHAGGLEASKGGARKVSDALCIPLCPDRLGVVGCHTKLDQNRLPFRDLEHRQAWLDRKVVQTHQRLLEEGLVIVGRVP